MKTRTLVDRMIARDKKLVNDAYTPYGHVRAELQRVARQVRKLHTTEMNSEHSWAKGYSTALNDALALIRKAEQ